MTEPTPIPFPTDTHSLLRCVRSFLDLLTLRVEGGLDDEAGCDYPLPGGLSLDAITCRLMAHAADDDATSADIGLEPYSEQDQVEEVVESIKRCTATPTLRAKATPTSTRVSRPNRGRGPSRTGGPWR